MNDYYGTLELTDFLNLNHNEMDNSFLIVFK